ncbi:hypothetical protein AURDEDRAFT_164714 [Auricularia subglabra TFB-10046 SS5]|nr:hypothetical protein AURDEDRAFT_164714 [Auricularia subglabra TFB-10046 SS5]
MPLLETTTRIAAPPDVVAGVFFDFASFPQWNPLIRSLRATTGSAEGRPTAGDVLEAQLAMGEHWEPLAAAPSVQRCDDREFIWTGQIGHALLLRTVHRYAWLPARDDKGATQWVHTEHFGGLLGWLFLLLFRHTLRSTFESMNDRLRARAEAKYAGIAS